jgi:hypothetical protein
VSRGRGFYVQTAAGIHIPGGPGPDALRVPGETRCQVPVEQNPLEPTQFRACGHRFFPHEDHRVRERHVSRCSRENHEVLMRYLRTRRPEIMQAWDPELERWVAQNKDALVEGRKRLGGGVA